MLKHGWRLIWKHGWPDLLWWGVGLVLHMLLEVFPPKPIDESQFVRFARLNDALLEVRIGGFEMMNSASHVVAHRARKPRPDFEGSTGRQFPAPSPIAVAYMSGVRSQRFVLTCPQSERLADLADLYHQSLDYAQSHHLASVLYPDLTRSMPYRYTPREAADIALQTVIARMAANADFERITFMLPTPELFTAFETSLQDMVQTETALKLIP